jgi:formylglycine-generating enzyme required for sulfatase activity
MQIAGEDPDLPDAKRQMYSPFFISVIATTNVNPRQRPGWHHVMVSYDGSKKAAGVSILVDGGAQPTAILDDRFVGTMKGTAPLQIGSRDGSYNFNGQVDDVRVYYRRLSEREVRALFESGIRSLAGISATERTSEQQKLLADAYRPRDELVSRLETQLAAAKLSLKSLQNSERDWIRRWYVNSQGQTFVIFDAGGFMMGSPSSEPDRNPEETQHRAHIGRRLAIATTLVTKDQFRRFESKVNVDQWVKTADSPQTAVTWYEATQYCNWLSKQEGIEERQWCYEPNEQGKYGPGMKPKERYLELGGYRLPTDAEWEFACRAETVTSRYYGASGSLLPRYAWYLMNSQNRTWPVASLKPNDYGLFDMQGDAWQWCDDAYRSYPRSNVSEDSGFTKPVVEADDRVLRGGAFDLIAVHVRSASRYKSAPANRNYLFGFRPARTYP